MYTLQINGLLTMRCHAHCSPNLRNKLPIIGLKISNCNSTQRLASGSPRNSRTCGLPSLPPLAAIASRAKTTTSVLAASYASNSDEEVEQLATELTWRDLWDLMSPDWRLIAACALATFVSVATSVSVAPALGRVIDVISAPGSTGKQLSTSVGILGAIYLTSAATLAGQVALATATSESLAARLRNRLFRALLSRSAAFYDTARTGAMTSWLGQDVEVLQTTVAKVLGSRGLRSVLETIGVISVLAWLSWPLALVLLLAAPLIGPLVADVTIRIRGASQESQIAAATASAAADEAVENMRIVRAFGAEKRQLERYQKLIDAAYAKAMRVVRLQTVLDVSGRARNALCVLITIALGSHLALASEITIGVCYSFFVYSFTFAFALSNVTSTLGELSRAAGTVARTLWVLRKCEDNDDEETLEGFNTNRIIPEAQFKGEIEFKDVSFEHPGGWTLQNIHFRIPAGFTLALVGPSGGGKSTIAALLLGLYVPKSGQIVIDGVSLSDLDISWWRRQVGVVEQAPGLLTGRVDDVIRYGKPDAGEIEVKEALEDAQATSFVNSLPSGESTLLGAGGVELSGGQNQRLALARALLPHPKVLVLDEATSALDVGTENAVAEALERKKEKTTTLVIAHRLSTVRRADCIVVVADGRVVESGAPGVLAMRENGVYARMLARKSGKSPSGRSAIDESDEDELLAEVAAVGNKY
jgi:ABC-type multidrug transport system fused ATPase/permease subunit